MDATIDATSKDSSLPPSAQKFLDETTMMSLLGIESDALTPICELAYELYWVGRYAEVAILCRGLIAADHTRWWPSSLYAAALRRLGRLPEALGALDKALARTPDAPELLFMRDEIREACAPQNRSTDAEPHPIPIRPSWPNPRAKGELS